MNNKGFTLVEVLAVVAILSILSGVAVAGVSKYLSNSREQAYESMASSAYDAAVSYMLDNNVYKEDGDISGINITFKTLVDEGYLEEPIDPRTKTNSCSCDDKSACYSNVYIKKNEDTSEEVLDNYKYEVRIYCSSGYSKVYKY